MYIHMPLHCADGNIDKVRYAVFVFAAAVENQTYAAYFIKVP